MPPCRMTQNYHVRKKKTSKSHGQGMTTGTKKQKRQRGRPDAFYGGGSGGGSGSCWAFGSVSRGVWIKSSLTQQIKTQSGSFLGNTFWFCFFFFPAQRESHSFSFFSHLLLEASDSPGFPPDCLQSATPCVTSLI